MRDRFFTHERREELKRMVTRGETDTTIAQALGCTRHSVRHERVRLGLAEAKADALQGVHIVLPPEVGEYFALNASRYETSPKALVIRALASIAEDGLIDMVMDRNGGHK